jgi:hypothetical protein
VSNTMSEWREENTQKWKDRLRSLADLYADPDLPESERGPVKALLDRARQYLTPNQFQAVIAETPKIPPVQQQSKELVRKPASLDINQAIQQVQESAKNHNEMAGAAVDQLRGIRRQLESRAERDFAVKNLRAVVANSGMGLDKKTRRVLCRAYHAIRVLHDYRNCKLKGCDFCFLGDDIAVAIGNSREMVQQTTYCRDLE